MNGGVVVVGKTFTEEFLRGWSPPLGPDEVLQESEGLHRRFLDQGVKSELLVYGPMNGISDGPGRFRFELKVEK